MSKARYSALTVLSIALFLALGAIASQEPDFKPYYDTERWIDMDGVKICRLDAGEGDPLILLHGWAGNAWNWSAVYDALAENRRVIVVDLPGHGKSGCPEGFGFSVPDYADFLARFMDEMEIERAAVAGNSMGGAIAAHFALRHPGRLNELVLVDAAGTEHITPMLKLAGLVVTKSTVIPLIHLAFPVNDETTAALPEPERRRVELAEKLYASERRDCAGKALARAMRSLGRHTLDEELEAIDAPTLVIWGSNDPLVPLEAGKRYARKIPGARLVVIEEGDHTPMQHKPAEFVEVIENFLAE